MREYRTQSVNTKKMGVCKREPFGMRTDIHSLDTDIAALVSKACIECHLSKPVHNHIQDT